MRETLRSLAKMEEAQVVPLLSISYNYNPSSQPEGPTTSLQSVATDDNGTPVTWTLVLSSSKPLTDRTGHYRAEGRFSSTGTTGDTTLTGTSHYRTRTRCTTTTCLVGYTPLRLHPATGTTRPSRNQPRRTPSHRAPLDTNTLTPTTSVQDTHTPLLSTGHPR